MPLFAVSLTVSAIDDGPRKFEMNYDGTVRTYSIYMPDSVSPERPLVIYTHGYGSKTRWCPDLNAVADTAGFVVCYPDGLPDSRGKEGWNVGYPAQHTLSIDEADFFDKFVTEVTERFDLDRRNVFMAGMSNGGDLCYQLAYTRPGLFSAYASVAGLTFEWVYNGHRLTDPVAFLEIHGNADKTSAWQGDHQNKGGWGSYIPVPLAVAAIAVNNRCTTMDVDRFVSLRDSTRIITHTRYGNSPSGSDVEVYEIDGGRHSWASKDLPTSSIIWNFFRRYLVKD